MNDWSYDGLRDYVEAMSVLMKINPNISRLHYIIEYK